MKVLLYISALTILTSCFHWNKIESQKPAKSIDQNTHVSTPDYKEVSGDPLKVREYTL